MAQDGAAVDEDEVGESAAEDRKWKVRETGVRVSRGSTFFFL